MSLLMRRRMLLSKKKKSRNLVNMYNYDSKVSAITIETLANGNLLITGTPSYFDIFSGRTGSSTTTIDTNRNPLLEVGTYTISWVTSSSFFVRLVSKETKSIVINNINWSKGYQSYTFTIEEPCYLMCGRATANSSTGTAEIGEIMVNEGTEALPYEPYED